MGIVCPECGYNAGESGEKILELHMVSQHGSIARQLNPEHLARERLENDIVLARTSLLLGVVVLLLGLGITSYGASNYAILNCQASACFIPQSLVDQIRTNGLGGVFVGAQETAYGGLLLFAFGSMGVAFWGARRVQLSQRIMLVLLVGIFLLVLVTTLAIAAGYIPFGQRITLPR